MQGSNRSFARAAAAAALLSAAGLGAAQAAYVTMGGVRHDSAPGYSVSAAGTDAHGQVAAASADELKGTVSGALVGPNWPPFLTAGFPIAADTGTGHPFGTHYTVHGLAAGTELTFTWRIAGSHSGAADAHAFRMEASWSLYNGRNLWLGNFDGLSYIDTTPGAGDFAGRTTGTFGCAPNRNSHYDACGTEWDGIGSRDVWVRDSSDEGWLRAHIAIAGSGEDSLAAYSIELIDVRAAASGFLAAGASAAAAPGPAYLAFDSGRQMPISLAPAGRIDLPASPALLLLGLLSLLSHGAARTGGGRQRVDRYAS